MRRALDAPAAEERQALATGPTESAHHLKTAVDTGCFSPGSVKRAPHSIPRRARCTPCRPGGDTSWALGSGRWKRQWYAATEEHRWHWIDAYPRGDFETGSPGSRVQVARPPGDVAGE